MNIGKPILWLVLAVAALFVLSAVAAFFAMSRTSVTADKPAVRRSMTPEEATASQNPKGFQMLISYSDGGFDPRTFTIKKGDNVRFYNGSSGDLWVASDPTAGPIYPGSITGCGSSAFDSCEALFPGEYYEFTFDLPGTWGFSNKLDAGKSGTVTVTKN